MATENLVILIGKLGDAPKAFSTENGSGANWDIATTAKWKDKQTGEQRERTEWHHVTAYDGLADIALKFFNKGQEVYVKGELRTRKWDDAQGVTHYTTYILAEKAELTGNKPASAPAAPARNAPAAPARGSKAGKS